MSKGDRYIVTGLLLRDGRFYVLHVDGGGTRIVDPGFFVRILPFVGRRVTVEGLRSGFNMIKSIVSS